MIVSAVAARWVWGRLAVGEGGPAAAAPSATCPARSRTTPTPTNPARLQNATSHLQSTMIDAQEAHAEPTTFEKAVAVLESADTEPDPGAPSCLNYRLRPSEIAAILQQRLANPPPPWGKKICLAKTFLGPEKCLAIGHKLILNRTVTFLDLSMCNLGEAAAPEFFSCVQRNTALRHLNLTGNAVGDAGAVAAAPCVLQLESLHLGSNGITDVGALAIAAQLAQSTKITALNLRANRITQYGIYKVLMALEDVTPQLSADLLSSLRTQEKANEDDLGTVTPPTAHTSASDILRSPKGSTAEDLPPQNRRAGPTKSAQPTNDTTRRSDALTESQASLFCEETPQVQPTAPPSVCLEEAKDPVFNQTLNVLWVDNNADIPEEMLSVATSVLAKRFPPPPPKPKKKKGRKAA